MKTYLFYDIETSGLNKSFDQILQFASIRTDMHLNEIERYEYIVKLNPDVIPSPAAMITHRLSLNELAGGISEYEAIQKIHQLLNTPETISLGFNTLGFDDEMLRFAFYRNLLPPYTHQYANQCGRMDIYPMVVMYYLFKNDVLAWPIIDDKVSLKLEALNKANHVCEARAHHAMVDVEVTLAIARKLFAEHNMWHYLSGYFTKATDMQRTAKYIDSRALMVLGKFGHRRMYQSQVLSLGNHFHYPNQTLWLTLDEQDFSGLTKENITDSIHVVRKKWGEPGLLLPLETRFMHHLTPERIEMANANMQWLADNPDMMRHLSDYHRGYQYPVVDDVDVDASLYLHRFWSPEEEQICRLFHAASSAEKSKIADEINQPRLREMAFRVLGRHFPQQMSASQSAYFSDYLNRIYANDTKKLPLDFKGEVRLSPSQAVSQIDAIMAGSALDSEQLALLHQLLGLLSSCTLSSQ